MRRSHASEQSVLARSDRKGSPAPAGPDPRQALRWGGRIHDHWLERWIRSTEDLARLQYSHRMVNAVIDEIDGRQIRIGDQWLTDYASCNYLGLDLDREIIDAVPDYLRRWGTHPSWSRLLGSPILYEQIEDKVTELLGCEDSLLLPTITHIHISVIPVLAGGGTVFLDRRAHKTIYDGCALAEGRGAVVKRFAHEDLNHLEACCAIRAGAARDDLHRRRQQHDRKRSDLAAFAALAREHEAILYVDDAHGFGVVGERSPDEPCDYGVRGNSIVRHLAESYENIVLVGGFSKAYSSLLAFIACPTALKQVLKTAAPPYLYSGPSPVASLATVLEGLRVNERAATSCAPSSTTSPPAYSIGSTSSASPPRTSPAFRSSKSRSPIPTPSMRSGTTCSTVASTRRWRCIRSSPARRSDSVCS